MERVCQELGNCSRSESADCLSDTFSYLSACSHFVVSSAGIRPSLIKSRVIRREDEGLSAIYDKSSLHTPCFIN